MNPPGFWRTVQLLLAASRTRSAGRSRRQQELTQQRSGSDWSFLAAFFAILLAVGINIVAAFVLKSAMASGPHIEPTHQSAPLYTGRNKIAVSQSFIDGVHHALTDHVNFFKPAEEAVPQFLYDAESKRIASETGDSAAAIEQKLREGLHSQGAQAFIPESESQIQFRSQYKARTAFRFTDPARLPVVLASFVLLTWFIMLVFQGEGLEMDLQRRRHPMWEWLFSHPVPSGAIFMAEMLSPIAANPVYWGAPLFVGFAYGFSYGFGPGALATLLIGVPVSIAAACMGKACEIAVILRCPPRTRGAMIGLMSWLGYASMMFFFVFAFVTLPPRLIAVTSRVLTPLTVLPWPYLRWFLGEDSAGASSFTLGMVTCWTAAATIAAAAVWFSVWGASQGLSGNFAADSRPSRSPNAAPSFGSEPLYRKELLWFIRDRSAIVQTILVPITVAGVQIFNLRGLINHAQGAWNYLCGTAILFGTYFLWVLGPKSLASEGNALWIALTWPRGLESLLKAKAWLWSMISYGVVALVLCYAAILFPSEIWKIGLVGVGWLLFGRSMAEKSVTLVTVVSDSGEVEKIPKGRRWAVQLGMLTFSIGVFTQQWHVAVMGIVYSWITAAAIWQNFRARLPFLYDPWSETLPPAPTLMHAMIAISILIEVGAVITGIFQGFFGREYIAIAQAMGYCICSAVVAFGTQSFLDGRDVPLREVINWLPGRPALNAPLAENSAPAHAPWWRRLVSRETKIVPSLLAGVAGGLLLGIFAHGYLAVLDHIPAVAEILRKSREQMAQLPGIKLAYFIMAVLFAPFAEEYLFRGLLYRALDREWGGWRAILGSAAFFAIYHGPLSWVPVGLVGIANALLFKKTGRLAPAVILHMVYNAVVLS